jgi:hypothetical protein
MRRSTVVTTQRWRSVAAQQRSNVAGEPVGVNQLPRTWVSSPQQPTFAKLRLGLLQTGEPASPKSGTQMAEPIARPMITRRPPARAALKFITRLIRPTIVTGMMAALIATADTPTVVPLACSTTWTMVGSVIWFRPDCKHQVPASQPPPNGPPPGDQAPAGNP